MPTFDFQCRKCSAVFEFARAFGDTVNPRCPTCGSKRTEKLLTPPSIQFKGSGFYKTDSAKRLTPKAKKTESTIEAKTETKPVEKKDTKETSST